MKRKPLVGVLIIIVGVGLLVVGIIGVRMHLNSELTSQRFSGIQNVDLEAAGPVQLKRGNVTKTKITYPKSANATKVGDTLRLTLRNRPKHSGISLFGGKHHLWPALKKTIITLPEGAKIGTVSSDIANSITIHHLTLGSVKSDGVGSVNLDHVTTRSSLDLENTGSVHVTASHFPTADLDVGAGNVTLASNTFKVMKVETGVGKIRFNRQNVGQSFTATSDVGTINGQIHRDRPMHVAVSTDMGKAILFGNPHRHRVTTAGKNTVNYRFTSDVGSITIH